jgi:hypothetical protein
MIGVATGSCQVQELEIYILQHFKLRRRSVTKGMVLAIATKAEVSLNATN